MAPPTTRLASGSMSEPVLDDPLFDLANPDRSRPALQELGEATWRTGLDWLFGPALERVVAADSYPQARNRFFGPSGQPAAPPLTGVPWPELLTEFSERIARATFSAHHPGSLSYFTPPPLPMSLAGEVLAQIIQQGVDVWHAGPIAAFVEEEVIAWLCELVGLPRGSFGVLTSGGVMANVMALQMARDVHLKRLRHLDRPPRGSDLAGVRVYASDQAHFSIGRGVGVLGFPEDSLVIVPTDDRYRMDPTFLAEAVATDRRTGFTPLVIAAVAGSTNTGSIDPLADLAELAGTQDLWFHVDAAYGGAAALSGRLTPLLSGIEAAHSVTIDPHKWFFQAYDIGGLLVRRREDLSATFHDSPEYYRSNDPENEPLNFYQYSFEGTRRFRALKLWMSWKHLGSIGLATLVEHTHDLARYLVRRCRELDCFEVEPPEPELSVVCFRHLPSGWESMPSEELDRYQTALQRSLEIDGSGWVSTTVLRGRTYLRAGIVNYLASEADIDRLLLTLQALSAQVSME